MALDELAATIDTLRQRIIDHRESIATNETRTRQVLIDPLLNSLGWDVTDPTSVELEYDVRGKRADYALLVSGKPVAVIEAKRLGRQLIDNDTMQVLNYANSDGIDYMVVTNGDQWNMFSVFERGAIEDRIIMELNLTAVASHVNALKSLSMWRSNLGPGESPVAASEPVLDVEAGRNEVDHPTDDEPSQIDNEGWIRLDEARYNARDPRPTRIRLPDQSEIRIASWKNVWISIAEWMVEREPQMTACSFGNTKPTVIKTTDEGFWGSGGYQLRNGLWIEPGVTGNTLLRTARSFLEHFNIEPSSVAIRFD